LDGWQRFKNRRKYNIKDKVKISEAYIVYKVTEKVTLTFGKLDPYAALNRNNVLR